MTVVPLRVPAPRPVCCKSHHGAGLRSRNPPAVHPPPWAGLLSARESEVLRCVAAGLSNAEIARHLHISVSTVKSHVAKLLVKTDSRDRVQMVVAAYTTGFVPVRPRPYGLAGRADATPGA